MQEARRPSISFSQGDSRRFSDAVDRPIPIREKEKSILGDFSAKSVLTNCQIENSKQVCDWIAKSYGQTDPAYHEAYNNEIFRQSMRLKTT